MISKRSHIIISIPQVEIGMRIIRLKPLGKYAQGTYYVPAPHVFRFTLSLFVEYAIHNQMYCEYTNNVSYVLQNRVLQTGIFGNS